MIQDLFKVIGGERYRGCWIAPAENGGYTVLGVYFVNIELAKVHVDIVHENLKDLKIN